MIDSLRVHGWAAPIIGTFPKFVEWSTPYFQWGSLVLGLSLGAVSLYLKYLEWRKLRKG